MKEKLILIFLLYLLPIGVWMGGTFHLLSPSSSWFITLIGLVVLFFGSTLLYTLLPKEEKKEQLSFISPSPPLGEVQNNEIEWERKISLLEEEVNNKEKTLGTLRTTHENGLIEYAKLKTELENIHAESSKQEVAWKNKGEEWEMKFGQQQKIIQQLETQIYDLRYEIKTLLQLTEVNYSHVFDPPLLTDDEPVAEEGKTVLKRWINKLQKLPSNYRTTSLHQLSDPFTFDLRHLKEMFSQSEHVIAAYSVQDKKMVMAAGPISLIVDGAADHFCQEFNEMMGDYHQKWEEVVASLGKGEVSFPLTLGKVSVVSYLAKVAAGPYRSLVIALFLPASHEDTIGKPLSTMV